MLRRIAMTLALMSTAPFTMAHDHEGTAEGTLLEVDPEERQITVLFEDGMTGSYKVAEDAEIFTGDGVLERPQNFSDLTAGQTVELAFDDPEDELRSITTRGEDTGR